MARRFHDPELGTRKGPEHDWLLRIHAAPFYAEPVSFYIDGMNDQKKKWLEDLQTPFQA
jgi:hypothetical protein